MKMSLNEDQVKGLVKKIVSEAFNDPELRKAIKNAGGLKKPTYMSMEDGEYKPSDKVPEDYVKYGVSRGNVNDATWNYRDKGMTGSNDVKSRVHNGDSAKAIPLDKANFAGYIERDEIEKIESMSPDAFDALKPYLLLTNDGRYILLKKANMFDADDLTAKRDERADRLAGVPDSEAFSGVHMSPGARKSVKDNQMASTPDKWARRHFRTTGKSGVLDTEK